MEKVDVDMKRLLGFNDLSFWYYEGVVLGEPHNLEVVAPYPWGLVPSISSPIKKFVRNCGSLWGEWESYEAIAYR